MAFNDILREKLLETNPAVKSTKDSIQSIGDYLNTAGENLAENQGELGNTILGALGGTYLGTAGDVLKGVNEIIPSSNADILSSMAMLPMGKFSMGPEIPNIRPNYSEFHGSTEEILNPKDIGGTINTSHGSDVFHTTPQYDVADFIAENRASKMARRNPGEDFRPNVTEYHVLEGNKDVNLQGIHDIQDLARKVGLPDTDIQFLTKNYAKSILMGKPDIVALDNVYYILKEEAFLRKGEVNPKSTYHGQIGDNWANQLRDAGVDRLIKPLVGTPSKSSFPQEVINLHPSKNVISKKMYDSLIADKGTSKSSIIPVNKKRNDEVLNAIDEYLAKPNAPGHSASQIASEAYYKAKLYEDAGNAILGGSKSPSSSSISDYLKAYKENRGKIDKWYKNTYKKRP